MRNLLLTAALAMSAVGFQTTAIAQPAGGPAQGSRAFCEAKWNGQVAHSESYDAFMDKCMSCEAKWDDMVATNTTEGQDRSAYLRRCARGAYWWGGNNIVPELGLLGLAGALVYVATLPDSP
jgi:hypothetical protein